MKHKIKAVKDVKYLSDDLLYEDIRFLFNETNEILSYEIKSYEAKPYKVECYEVRSNKIKSYEIDYIDIKPYDIKFYGVTSNKFKSYEAKPYEVEYCEVRSNEIKFYEIDYNDIKPHEIKSYDIEFNETESNEDYYIENIKSEFEKISNNLVEVHNKDVRYMVDYFFLFLNWYSLHARLSSHYEAWSYKKRKHKKVTSYRKSI